MQGKAAVEMPPKARHRGEVESFHKRLDGRHSKARFTFNLFDCANPINPARPVSATDGPRIVVMIEDSNDDECEAAKRT